ncbi:hypothetical protein A5662_26640 [Mycobacteriaceae bacterium 1482268.1]|nr:hypothetical protein A5662_26640 [Mycobacteriaceae bacterium 1482268.1]
MRKPITTAFVASAAALAMAVPVTLLGAGTAHADTRIKDVAKGPAGVIVTIQNLSKEPGWCTYSATPVDSLLLPYHSLPFHLGGLGTPEGHSAFNLVIPGLATGTGWIPAVACDNGVSQETHWEGEPAPIVY